MVANCRRNGIPRHLREQRLPRSLPGPAAYAAGSLHVRSLPLLQSRALLSPATNPERKMASPFWLPSTGARCWRCGAYSRARYVAQLRNAVALGRMCRSSREGVCSKDSDAQSECTLRRKGISCRFAMETDHAKTVSAGPASSAVSRRVNCASPQLRPLLRPSRLSKRANSPLSHYGCGNQIDGDGFFETDAGLRHHAQFGLPGRDPRPNQQQLAMTRNCHGLRAA